MTTPRRAARARALAWGMALLLPVLLLPPLWRQVEARGWCVVQARDCAENETYAARYFAGLVPIEAVLASREWHTWHDDKLDRRRFGSHDCTFAVARLADPAPATPPEARDRDVRGWRFTWGGDWRPGGTAPTSDTSLGAAEAFDVCSVYWDASLARELADAVADPRSFVAGEGPGAFYLYAPASRLVARLRLDD